MWKYKNIEGKNYWREIKKNILEDIWSEGWQSYIRETMKPMEVRLQEHKNHNTLKNQLNEDNRISNPRFRMYSYVDYIYIPHPWQNQSSVLERQTELFVYYPKFAYFPWTKVWAMIWYIF